jgi:hypothetical protein
LLLAGVALLVLLLLGVLLVVLELLLLPDEQAAMESANSTEAVTRAIGVLFIATLPFVVSSENR